VWVWKEPCRIPVGTLVGRAAPRRRRSGVSAILLPADNRDRDRTLQRLRGRVRRPSEPAHSRSSVDLDTIATTAAQEEGFGDRERAAAAAVRAERDKIEAIALWSTPLVVGTADTVLGLLANARKPICTLPAILQAGIVFDEIHAFDDRLFGHLLVFLRNFPGVPVLLMTASLPQARLDDLRAARADLAVIPGPRDRKNFDATICGSAQPMTFGLWSLRPYRTARRFCGSATPWIVRTPCIRKRSNSSNSSGIRA